MVMAMTGLGWLPGSTAGPSSWRVPRGCVHGAFGDAVTRSAPGGQFSGPGPGVRRQSHRRVSELLCAENGTKGGEWPRFRGRGDLSCATPGTWPAQTPKGQ